MMSAWFGTAEKAPVTGSEVNVPSAISVFAKVKSGPSP